MQAVKRTPDRTINIEPEMLNFGRDSRWHRKPLFSQKRGCRKICPFLTFLGDFLNRFWGSKSNSLSILVPASPNNRRLGVKRGGRTRLRPPKLDDNRLQHRFRPFWSKFGFFEAQNSKFTEIPKPQQVFIINIPLLKNGTTRRAINGNGCDG